MNAFLTCITTEEIGIKDTGLDMETFCKVENFSHYPGQTDCWLSEFLFLTEGPPTKEALTHFLNRSLDIYKKQASNANKVVNVITKYVNSLK